MNSKSFTSDLALKPQKVDISLPDPDHIYIDGTFYNDSGTNGNPTYLPATLSQIRSSAFLHDPKEWNIAIARFNLADSGPNFRVYADNSWDSVNTPEWVAVSYNNTYFDAPVVIPFVSGVIQENIRAAKSIYDYLDIINAAFLVAQTNLLASPGYAGPTGDGQVVMTYDEPSEFYHLNIPDWYGEGGGVGPSPPGQDIGVHMSHQLYQRFQSFSVAINSPLLYNNHDVTFIRKWRGNNAIAGSSIYLGSASVPTRYMVLSQDGSWPSSVSDFYKLVITTNTLPVTPEFTDRSSMTSIGGNNNSTTQILTDFVIGRGARMTNNQAEPYVYYPELYRLVSLYGSGPLNKWDLTFQTMDRFGQLYPFYVAPNGYIDVKLVFIRKRIPS